jgi:hypothetical protein
MVSLDDSKNFAIYKNMITFWDFGIYPLVKCN